MTMFNQDPDSGETYSTKGDNEGCPSYEPSDDSTNED